MSKTCLRAVQYMYCSLLLKVWVNQTAYAERVLHKFSMDNAKVPVATPVNASAKLVKATDDCDSVDQGL